MKSSLCKVISTTTVYKTRKTKNVGGFQRRGAAFAVSPSRQSCVLSRKHTPVWDTAVDHLAKNMVLTSLSLDKLDCHFARFLNFFFHWILGYCRHPLGRILSNRETSQQVRRLESVTRAGIHQVVSHEWMKYLFWVNYPFNASAFH